MKTHARVVVTGLPVFVPVFDWTTLASHLVGAAVRQRFNGYVQGLGRLASVASARWAGAISGHRSRRIYPHTNSGCMLAGDGDPPAVRPVVRPAR